jgi:hypothetical protein
MQCHPALPLAHAGLPLIAAARAELHQRGAERVMAVAALPGLCRQIVDEAAWLQLRSRMGEGDFNEEQPAAVEAVARGVPRPGHSVLGVGTFEAARPGIEVLALDYAQHADEDTEAGAYRAAGADLAGVHYMHDTSAEAMRESAGCTAGFEFGLYEGDRATEVIGQ